MSATSSAASSGVVLGIVLVFLAQQFGLLALTDLATSVLYFAIGAIVLGVVFGVAARVAGRRPITPK
jgi:hypothetical protein